MPSPAVETYGPIFVGCVLNILLYGIMITQTFLYFTVYKRDKLWMKLFVGLLFLCDTLNCAFDIAFVYMPLVNGFGDIKSLNYASWVFGTDPAMTAFIAMFVQMFFAWRVKVLTGSIPAVLFIMFCSFCQWCGGLGTSIAVGMIPEFTHFQQFEVIVIIWLAFSAVADSAITTALVWHLRKHRTGFSQTDDIVNKIIRLTVQTGLITALCAIIDLILFLATPAGLHLIFNLPLSKLYTNSLMSSLNSRAGWKYGNVGASTGASEISRANMKGLSMHGDMGKRGQEVFIDVESHEMIDVMDKSPLPSPSDALKSYAMPVRQPSEKTARFSVGAVPPRPSAQE
ncbi:uncharacterized protein LAESUDRAFT_748519 [Laetiporus sulphureus 93-53]|uniref:DUF6534 domain-containing protein n=1 Tax=Laetiporus sulphureus 93-53 TaxID=1314785 RepID=A0A165FTI2_9APHY|nr:uncharacterized protein LAESUDRAFT_748519 [Laetiporus sulphureus 93-53]KZT09390.1 hypothetical protein LAESUDRAFT_748519 [Laetiporus sulphureus 93-53]